MAFSGVQKSILILTLIIFVAGVVFMGLSISKTSTADKRVVASCPDFWYNANYVPCRFSAFGCCADELTPKTDASGSMCNTRCADTPYKCCEDGYTPSNADGSNCQAATANCYNINQLGNYGNTEYTCKEQKFDIQPYIGVSGNCEKQKYANKCNVSWDGITNMPDICTTPTTTATTTA
jgi:hypothetical protein